MLESPVRAGSIFALHSPTMGRCWSATGRGLKVTRSTTHAVPGVTGGFDCERHL